MQVEAEHLKAELPGEGNEPRRLLRQDPELALPPPRGQVGVGATGEVRVHPKEDPGPREEAGNPP